MPRATNAPASRARRKRVVAASKGYRGRRSKLFRYAKDAQMKGKYWAYRDRKTRKRNFRALWITRLSAAVRAAGGRYVSLVDQVCDATTCATLVGGRPLSIDGVHITLAASRQFAKTLVPR